MLLRESLRPFFLNLTKEDRRTALRAVAHFVLTNDYKEYRERIKVLNKSSYSIFYKEVRNFVKSSFECRKVWRAVHYSLAVEETFEKSSAKFGVDMSDINLVWKSLSEEDRKEIEVSSKKEEYGFLDKETLATLLSQLDKYCGKVSYLKLRFLSDNDRSFDLTDLRAELLVHGIQVVRAYEHTKDLKMIENYAKASIQNHAINMIQHHTSESRACVKNTTVGCGTCIFCLTDKPQRCHQAVANYRTTTLSMEELSIDLLGRTKSDVEEKLATESLLSTLREGASPELKRVVDLVFGTDTDPDFEAWLLSQHDVSVDSLSENPKRLVKLLCQYLDLPTKKVHEHLRVRYEQHKSQQVA